MAQRKSNNPSLCDYDMILSAIEVREHASECELTARLTCETSWILDDQPFDLWYRFPRDARNFLDPENADPYLAALLAPAMCLGEPLRLEGKASPKLLQASKKIQTIFRSWKPALAFIDVEVDVGHSRGNTIERAVRRNGLFYSLGADSGYSLAKNLHEHVADDETITDLVTVLGFDVYLTERTRFVAMLENVKGIGAAFGKEILPASTNLREFTDKIADWVELEHGAALASVGLALGEKFSQLLIAATHTYARLLPLGSHPVLDPLWSTETLSFSHDGCEASRLDKLRRLAEVPELLATLRVCATGETTDAYNCGRCPKCLMTMIGLHIVDALDRCGTFSNEINLDSVRHIPIRNSSQRIYLQELADGLGEGADDLAIKRSIDECLAQEYLPVPA
jgi:hypothetical protein